MIIIPDVRQGAKSGGCPCSQPLLVQRCPFRMMVVYFRSWCRRGMSPQYVPAKPGVMDGAVDRAM